MTAPEPNKPRIYLAGPEVFRRDARSVGTALAALAEQHGLAGLYPLDNALAQEPGETPAAFAARIRQANLDLIRDSDGMVANVAPFRGPGVDDGTAFEIGVAAALGLPVFLYSSEQGTILERTQTRMAVSHDGTDWRDQDGLLVEDFGLPVNLMLCDPAYGPVHASADLALAAAARYFSLR